MWELNNERQPEVTLIFSHISTQSYRSQTMTIKTTETNSDKGAPSITGDGIYATTILHKDRVQSLRYLSLAVIL